MMNEGFSSTDPELISAILYANKVYIEHVKSNSYEVAEKITMNDFKKTKYSHLWENVKIYLKPIKDEKPILIDSTGKLSQPEPWYKDPDGEEDSYWQRYLELLLKKGWYDAINDIRTSTRDLIDRIPDPEGEELDVYGMVVGRVQSGKTANFTGLIARAADSGYNLIIVLSGTVNNLRNQTQVRLLRELTGHGKHPRGFHVEKPKDTSNEFILLTTDGDDDFAWPDTSFLYSPRPKLAVIKKNVTIMEKLYHWLAETTKEQRENLKLLLIDDECDYGSINTNRKRAKTEDLRISDNENHEYSDEDERSSKTNSYLRGILNLFPRRAYLGYTATPYANVMIDPNPDGAEFDFDDGKGLTKLGKTLYPRNFIKLLESPKNYLGLDEIFSDSDEKHLKPEFKYRQEFSLEASRVRNGIFNIDKFPQFLEKALLDYIVSGALKKQNINPEKWGKVHHTMMVHVSKSVNTMSPLAALIDSRIKYWKRIIWDDYEPDYEPLKEKLKYSWESYEKSLNFEIDMIRDFIDEIQDTRLVNSENDDDIKGKELNPDLDFESSSVKGIIIGGDLLSRGLTIEGLTISYFIRRAGTYDSAIQMCRWNGVRSALEKEYIRVYMEEDMKEDYFHLKRVENDLRADIEYGHKNGMTPSDYGIRVLIHKVKEERESPFTMTPTNRKKMVSVIKVDRGIHKTIQQTKGFYLEDEDIMSKNSSLTIDFLSELKLKEIFVQGKNTGHYLCRKVNFSKVWNLINNLDFPERGFNKLGIIGYFKYMQQEFPLTLDKWSVILIGAGDGRKFSLDDKVKIRMPTRKKNSLLGIRELATDRHLSLDLEGYPNGLVNEKNQFTRIKMFEKREEDNPVLILYLLDPLFENNDYPFYQDIEVPPPEIIPAPVIVLPDKKLDDESLEELIAYYRLECLPGSGR